MAANPLTESLTMGPRAVHSSISIDGLEPVMPFAAALQCPAKQRFTQESGVRIQDTESLVSMVTSISSISGSQDILWLPESCLSNWHVSRKKVGCCR